MNLLNGTIKETVVSLFLSKKEINHILLRSFLLKKGKNVGKLLSF